MRLEIYRVYSLKLNDKQKEILKKYNLEIEEYIETHFYTKDEVKENYYITINNIEQLFDISKELDEDLIINKDKSILIYDDYIE